MSCDTRQHIDSGSRISSQIQIAGDNAAVRGALQGLMVELASDAGIELADVLDITLVGNPVMHHLLLGIAQ